MKNKLATILVLALSVSIACNIIQGIYTEKDNLNQQQVAEYITQKEIYWTLAVEDYLISLQKGETEDTLDLVYSDEEKEMHLLSFEKEKDYIEPADISAEVFENCLGHNGFILYKRYSLGRYVHYYEAEYYAVDEELEFLAYRWGSRDDNFYEVDVDGDSINELICNVTWLADGGEDVYIYHFDGEKVMKAFGSDLLDQPFDNHGLGAIYTTYLPDIKKVHIQYWQDALEGYAEADYDIDLDKLELYETSIQQEETVINDSNKMNDEGVTYTLKVNKKAITENTIDVTAGDIILSLTEEISEDVAYRRIEGNYLSTGIGESILDIDYPAEEDWRDGTVVTSCEYHMKEVPSEKVIHVTITKELQQRLGLESDVIQIHCK